MKRCGGEMSSGGDRGGPQKRGRGGGGYNRGRGHGAEGQHNRGRGGNANNRGGRGRDNGMANLDNNDFPDLVQAFLNNRGADNQQRIIPQPVQQNPQRGGRGNGEPRGSGRGQQPQRGGGGASGRGGNRKKQGNQNESLKDSSSDSEDERRISRPRQENKKKFEGPVFGFKRLYKFLETGPEEVLKSIYKDKVDWRLLLESSELEGEKLLVAVHVIAEKVCIEMPILTTQQTTALTVCCSEPFIKKLDDSVGKIAQGIFVSSRKRNNEFPVESDPIKVLDSLYQFCSFAVKIMPDTANDYLGGLIVKCMGASVMCDPTLAVMNKFKGLNDQMKEISERKFKKQEKLLRQRRQGFNEEDEAEFDADTPPDDYRDIDVIPSIDELRCKSQEIFLRPNKKHGAYQSASHYLDVQFRLLREDFVQPLRKGIATFLKDKGAYLEGGKRMPLGEVRLYVNVGFIRVEKERESIVHKLQLDEKNYKRIKWDKSKRLLTGSLIVFTPVENCFSADNTHFGVVFNRNVNELSKGILTVTWEGSPPVYDQDHEYLILESEVYLEAYRHTLETLKCLELDRFSMQKFIVRAESSVEAPLYLKTATRQLKLKLANGEEIYVSPLDARSWPTAADLGFDENQFQAFQAAIINEFTTIQGPPGTGKTFLGLKAAETLLINSDLWEDPVGNPITVVCYTNHALDQFLEGILHFYQRENVPAEIIRIGGRCKSEELEKYSLRQVRMRSKRKLPPGHYAQERCIRESIQELEDTRYSKMNEVMGLQNVEGIVDFQGLSTWNTIQPKYPMVLWNHLQRPSWLGLGDEKMKRVKLEHKNIVPINFGIQVRELSKRQPRRESKATPVLKSDQVARNNLDDDHDLYDEEEYDIDELLDHRILDDILLEADTTAKKNVGRRLSYLQDCSVHNIEKEMRRIRNNLVEATKGLNMAETMKIREEKGERLIILERRQTLLKEICDLYVEQRLDLPDVGGLLEDIRSGGTVHYDRLTLPEKWSIYFTLVKWARQSVAESVAEVEANLGQEQKALRETLQYADGLVLRGCKVVGLTTTGAAKYNNLLRMIKSKIVIVEEAAEVFESHIVTCITESCQQLILIGDHRQLRPSPTVYDLAIKYHLDLSLFERMINNNLHCYPLKIQHRMRPAISDLVVGTIYDELVNHESVALYPDVKGITKNVFFVSHQELESSETDSMSKSNTHEAKFMSGLCRYLVLQGYKPEEITILTMYTGQMFLLKKECHASCKGVRITCVDNFQGEENKIILLSLVRSNTTGKIGFLSIDNRVCVSLSRAKHGLYIVGNMTQMDKYKTWNAIKQKLELQDQIGTELEIQCQIHGVRNRVKKGEDFMEKAPQGGCLEPCDMTLPCSHKCNQVCHVLDRTHEMFRCLQPCIKNCEKNLHPCKGRCSEACPPCRIKVEKTLHCELQHKKMMDCHKDEAAVICWEQVLKRLPCNHEETLACHIKAQDYTCRIKVNKTLPCGHDRVLECNVDPSSIRCKVIARKTLPCNHQQDAECWLSDDSIKCVTLVPKKFPKCGHETQVKCGEKTKPIVCRGNCTTRLNCGHACVKVCHVDDDPDHLTYQCKKPCGRECIDGHKCKASHHCCQSCPPCKETVTRTLPCGHTAQMECHVDKTQYECMQPCERILPGHLCRHKCPNLCFQPCGPCDKIVMKRAPCGHPQQVLCEENPLKESCEVPVTPRILPVCGHRDSKVPCKYDSLSAEEVSKYCQHPCSHEFQPAAGEGCGHHCLGSCSLCKQGRIHMKCGTQCGKQLVCGHVCEVPCSAVCPPCKKPCMMKCEHTECKKNCGEPCSECKEKCSWRCEHLQCTNLCGDLCNREPCDEPCKKKLKCGHDCVGFCGEDCPPLCRICDEDELTEIFFGEEDEPNARFVYLKDCNHTIEVGGLKEWLDSSSSQICSKKCPKCKTSIRNNRRFGNRIKQHYQDIVKVKMLTFGNKANSDKMRDKWISELEMSSSVGRIFPQIRTRIRQFLVKEIDHVVGNRVATKLARIDIDEFSMKSLNFIADSANKIALDLLNLKGADKLVSPFYEKTVGAFRSSIEYMLDRQPLSRQEIIDFNEDLDRLDCYKQLMMRRSLPNYTGDNSKANVVFTEAETILKSVRPFTTQRRALFETCLKNLDELLRTGLGITHRERQEILQAMGMRQGHWYKCPNGHIYVIGDCGRPWEVSRCNVCGATIGGMSHSLQAGNQQATEMFS